MFKFLSTKEFWIAAGKTVGLLTAGAGLKWGYDKLVDVKSESTASSKTA